MNAAIKKIKLRISQLIGLGSKIHREFFDAVKHNDLDKVNQFLDAGFNPNCIEEKRSAIGYVYSPNSPLTIAAHNNNEPIVLALLKAGADVAHKGNYGSAFWITSDVNIAKILLDAGAYIDEGRCVPSDGFSRTKLQEAAESGDIEMVRLLIDRGAGASIKWADNLEIEKLLVDYLVDD